MRWVLRRGVAADELDADIDAAAFATVLRFRALIVCGIVAAHGAVLALLFGKRTRIDAVVFTHFEVADGLAIVRGCALLGRIALRRIRAGSFNARNRGHSSTVTHCG